MSQARNAKCMIQRGSSGTPCLRVCLAGGEQEPGGLLGSRLWSGGSHSHRFAGQVLEATQQKQLCGEQWPIHIAAVGHDSRLCGCRDC